MEPVAFAMDIKEDGSSGTIFYNDGISRDDFSSKMAGMFFLMFYIKNMNDRIEDYTYFIEYINTSKLPIVNSSYLPAIVVTDPRDITGAKEFLEKIVELVRIYTIEKTCLWICPDCQKHGRIQLVNGHGEDFTSKQKARILLLKLKKYKLVTIEKYDEMLQKVEKSKLDKTPIKPILN